MNRDLLPSNHYDSDSTASCRGMQTCQAVESSVEYSGSDGCDCRANAVKSVTNPNNQFQEFVGRRVTVMGLGRFGGGLGAVEFLVQAGALVSVTDQRTADQLADSLKQIQHLPLQELELGRHSERLFRECDLLVVNPAVRPDHPSVDQARQNGIEITTEIEIFCRRNPARTIAVTGSNGKSTTTALIHHLLQPHLADHGRRAWLGGNIGGSLLHDLPQIHPADWVILELSSFQLEHLRQRRFRPDIAVITNLSPNHLDWHDSYAAYYRAKQGILDGQLRTDKAVLQPRNIVQTKLGRGSPVVESFGLVLKMEVRTGVTSLRGFSYCVLRRSSTRRRISFSHADSTARRSQPVELCGGCLRCLAGWC